MVLCSCDTGMDDLPFGGLNVILVGNFHQFPPVVSGCATPLYYPNNIHPDKTDDIIGREIYQQFSTMVRLQRQVRVVDAVWENLLQNVQNMGAAKNDILNYFGGLLLPIQILRWSITMRNPRHGVRKLWNTAAAKKACVHDQKPLLISTANDVINGQPLYLAEIFAVLTKAGQKKDGGEDRAGLMKMVELAISMPVMVTWNVHTELDVANGS